MRELEVKLSVDGPYATPPLAQGAAGIAGMRELPSQDLRASYYDTQDLRLARHGITLRYRSGEGDGSQWTLKLPVEARRAIEREELTFEGGPRKVPADARELTTAFVRSAELAPVTRLRTRRRRWSLSDADGSELAELVDDRVSVLQEGRIVARFRELEVEARSARDSELREIARVLEQAGAAPTVTPKALRALGARALSPPDVIAPEKISPSEPAALAVQAAIARSLRRMMINDPGTRLGDTEALHQMRVGTRRMRSDLRTFAELVDPDWSRAIVGELRWLTGALGEVRDVDVLRARLRPAAAGLDPAIDGLFEQLAQRHSQAHRALLEVLRSDRYVELLDRLVSASREPALAAPAWQPGADVLPALAAKPAKKLIRRMHQLDQASPDADYHRVRILAKRARYACEAIAPAVGDRRGEEVARFGRRAADIQDVLGELQDTIVAGEAIGDFVSANSGDPDACVAAGRLLERQQRAGDRAREGFPRARKRLRRGTPSMWRGETGD